MARLKRLFLLLLSVCLTVALFFQAAGQELPPDAILDVAWNSDGNRIARIFANGTVEVIQAVGGQVVFTYNSGLSLTDAALEWNPTDSTRLAAGIERNVFVWDVTTGEIIFTFLAGASDGLASTETGVRPEVIVSLGWNSGGDRLVTLSRGGFLRIWNTTNGTMTLDAGIAQSNSIAWNPSGTKLVTGAGLGIRTVDPITGDILVLGANSLQPGSITSTDWSPDGTKIVNGTVLGDVTIWDAATGERIRYFRDNTELISEVKWGPDSGCIASAGWDGAIRIWDADTGQQLDVIRNTGRMFTVDWSPDGTQLVYGGESSDGQSVMEIVPAPASCEPSAETEHGQ